MKKPQTLAPVLKAGGRSARPVGTFVVRYAPEILLVVGLVLLVTAMSTLSVTLGLLSASGCAILVAVLIAMARRT